MGYCHLPNYILENIHESSYQILYIIRTSQRLLDKRVAQSGLGAFSNYQTTSGIVTPNDPAW